MSFFTVAEVKGIDKPGFIPVIVHCDGTGGVTILKCGHTKHTESEAKKCVDLAFRFSLVEERMRKGEPYLLGRDYIPSGWIKYGKGPECPYKTCTRTHGKMDIHVYPAFMNEPPFYWCRSCGYCSKDEQKLKDKGLLREDAKGLLYGCGVPK